MTDLPDRQTVKEALAVRDDVHKNGPNKDNYPFPYAQAGEIVEAAARAYVNPQITDEMVERAAKAMQPYIDVDPAIDPNEWGLAQLHTARIAARAALEAAIRGDTDADR